MRIATIIIRILMGLLYIMAAVTYFFNLVEVPPVAGDVKTFNDGLAVAIYLMPLVKVLELLCGTALLLGRFSALTAVVILPITINIFLFHAFLAPAGMYLQTFLLLGNFFLLYAYRYKYRPMFCAT